MPLCKGLSKSCQRFKLPAGGEEGQGPPAATMKKEASTCTMDKNPESKTAGSLDGQEQAQNRKFKCRSTPLEWMELLILVLLGQ